MAPGSLSGVRTRQRVARVDTRLNDSSAFDEDLSDAAAPPAQAIPKNTRTSARVQARNLAKPSRNATALAEAQKETRLSSGRQTPPEGPADSESEEADFDSEDDSSGMVSLRSHPSSAAHSAKEYLSEPRHKRKRGSALDSPLTAASSASFPPTGQDRTFDSQHDSQNSNTLLESHAGRYMRTRSSGKGQHTVDPLHRRNPAIAQRAASDLNIGRVGEAPESTQVDNRGTSLISNAGAKKVADARSTAGSNGLKSSMQRQFISQAPRLSPGKQGPGNLGPGNRGPGTRGPGTLGPDNRGPGTRGPGNRGPGDAVLDADRRIGSDLGDGDEHDLGEIYPQDNDSEVIFSDSDADENSSCGESVEEAEVTIKTSASSASCIRNPSSRGGNGLACGNGSPSGLQTFGNLSVRNANSRLRNNASGRRDADSSLAHFGNRDGEIDLDGEGGHLEQEARILLRSLQLPLYFVNRHWKQGFLDIMLRALTGVVNVNACDLDRHNALVIFLILPGLFNAFYVLHLKKTEKEKPVDFLSRLATCTGDEFFAEARRILAALGSPADPPDEEESLASLSARADKRFRQGRLSSSLSMMEQIRSREEAIPEEGPVNPRPRLSRAEARNKISVLFPEAPEEDEEAFQIDLDVTLRRKIRQHRLLVSQEDIRTCIAKSNSNSGNGPTGWTFNLIKCLLVDSAEDGSIAGRVMVVVQQLFQLAIDGALPQTLARTWSASKIALLPKPGSNDYRPISIGDAWYRLFGKAVLRVTATKISPRLLPLQLALNFSGGGEIAARIAQALFDDNGTSVDVVGDEEEEECEFFPCILSLDLKNAFNTLPRRHVIASLLDHDTYGALGLLPLFFSFYGGVSDLVDAQGSPMGLCRTGVKQGCPMGMLFYVLGFHPLLKRISSLIDKTYTECVETYDLPRHVKPFSFAYADDCNSGSDARIIVRALPGIESAVSDYGMQLNMHKTKLITMQSRTFLDRIGRGTRGACVTRCADILGVPVGEQEIVKGRVTDSLSSMTDVLDTVLRWMNPQAAYTLLRVCINARPQFLARIVEIHQAWFFKALQGFDARINCALAKLLRVGPAHVLGVSGRVLQDEDHVGEGAPLIDGPLRHIQLQRGLPFSLGGGGMPIHSCVAALSQESSRALTSAYLQDYGFDRLMFIIRSKTWRGEALWDPLFLRCHQKAEDLRRDRDSAVPPGDEILTVARRDAEDDAIPQPTSTGRSGSIKAKIQRMYKEVLNTLYSLLTTDSAVACLRSQACVGTGGVLAWMGGSDPRFLLGAGAFTGALRARYLLHPCYEATGHLRACACGVAMENMLHGHAWTCDLNAGLRTRCHNAIVESLAALLRKNKDGAVVEGKKTHTWRTDPQRWVESDLEYVTPHQRVSLDVSCVDPGSFTSRTHHHSATVAGAAAAAREHFKRGHYAPVLPDNGTHRMVPIVFETTGRLGPEAVQFLDAVFPPGMSSGYGSFLTHASAIIARYTASMVEASWGRMAGDREGGGEGEEGEEGEEGLE